MDQFIAALSDFVSDHWIKFLTGLGIMAAGWVLGRWRSQAQWRKREFFDRLNVSLNTIDNGKLLIRTISEKSCRDVFLNDVAVRMIAAAAQKTTAEDPTLPLPKDDYWYYLNSVLNEVAEQFAEGQLRRDIGQPVQRVRYLICLTCECAGELRTRKVRAMLIQRAVLEKLPETAPTFEASHHGTRWQTLQILARLLTSQPHRFLDVEICL